MVVCIEILLVINTDHYVGDIHIYISYVECKTTTLFLCSVINEEVQYIQYTNNIIYI